MGSTRTLPQRGRDLVGLGHVQRGTIDDTKGFPEIKSTPAYGRREHRGAWTCSYPLGRWGARGGSVSAPGSRRRGLQSAVQLVLSADPAVGPAGTRARATASSRDGRVLACGSG